MLHNRSSLPRLLLFLPHILRFFPYLLLFIFILVGVVLLFFAGPAFAQGSADNPFALSDQAHEERLRLAKDAVSGSGHDMSSQALDEQNQSKESDFVYSGDSFIVKFKDDVSLRQIFEIVDPHEYKLIGNSKLRLFVLELTDVQEFKRRTIDLVDYIEENRLLKSDAVPSDPGYASQWALPAIKIPEAWDISKGSDSVLVAVIDSGIYRSHPDFVGVDIRGGVDYVLGGPCNRDATGHGTNVTGIIGAKTDNGVGVAGVNWDVAIVPLGIIWSNGYAYSDDLIAAIYDAANMGCKVINLSLGGNFFSDSESAAISYAVAKGCIVVAAAGNSGESNYNYPASYDGVISVASVDSSLNRSSFSQYNDQVDVAAPGENIYSTAYRYKTQGKDYIYNNGTSFSAPYVSGIAALAAALEPSITYDEFYDALIGSCTDRGAAGYDYYYGHGLIDAEKLLMRIVNTLSYNITAEAASPRAGTVTGAGTFAYGIEITVTAQAEAGYRFISWTEHGARVSADPDYTFTVTADRDLTANFEEDRALYRSLGLKSDVAPTKNWLVKFNEAVDPTTVNAENILVTDANGVNMPVSYMTGAENGFKAIEIIPQSSYLNGETYTVWLKDIRSASGKTLAEWTLMDFTIQQQA